MGLIVTTPSGTRVQSIAIQYNSPDINSTFTKFIIFIVSGGAVLDYIILRGVYITNITTNFDLNAKTYNWINTLPFRRTAFGQSAFSVKATNQWKTLPDNVRSCSSISTFKTNLKRLLKAAQLCTHWSLFQLHGLHDLLLLDKHTLWCAIVCSCVLCVLYVLSCMTVICFFVLTCQGTTDVN